MMTLALSFMVLGFFCGYTVFPDFLVSALGQLVPFLLYLLIFAVGLDIGANHKVFLRLRQHGLKLLLVPLAVAAGSVLGGVLAGVFFSMPANVGASVGSGFAWYSLSAVLLQELAGAQVGTIAFLSNVFREVLAILLIPLIAKISPIAAVAPAGATSMDTTLPVIKRYTNDEVAVIAMLNGIVLTVLVPILVPFFYQL